MNLQIDARTRLSPAEVAMEQLRNAIVAMLHHSEPLEALDAVSEIFIPLDDSNRVELKKHVLAKWVPNESVEILMGATRGPARIGVLTIESMTSTAVDQYLNRARIELPGRTVWAFSVSAAAPDTDEAIVAHVENAIRERMAPQPFQDESGKELPLPQVSAVR